MRLFPAVASISLLMTAVSGVARAALPDDRVDFSMYGRMGVAWTMTGQFISGRTLNLAADRPNPSIGGRFEEGDYLEPTVTAHILKKDETKPQDTYIDMVISPAMFPRNGSFLGFFSNFNETLRIELFQAYVEAGNVFIPDLIFWGGARFYRGADVHNADYFYFNDLSGHGGGVKYKGLDLAILLRSPQGDRMYSFDSDDMDDLPDVQRQRTIFVAQYSHNFGPRTSFVQGLTELHLLPSAKTAATPELAPADFGWVAGVKLHLDLDKGNFNDTSIRYGSRIANGSWSGTRTFQTFGPAEPNGHYDGAYGLEIVDHFLFNLGPMFTINGYGLLNISRSAVQPTDVISEAPVGNGYKTMNWAGGIRGSMYAHRQFHMIAEASVQGRKDGDERTGTAVKLSLVPTVVPSGETTVWARPHFRAIYTAGIYNQAAVDQRMSPYLRVTGSQSRFGHYVGARTEWWF